MEYAIVDATQWCKSSFCDAFFNVISWFGDKLFFLLAFTLLYWVYKKEFALKYGLFYLISVGINGFLKITVNRTRPNGLGGSFPSGHSQSFAFQATMVGREVFRSKTTRLRNKIFIAVDLFVAWFMVAYSRLYLNKHFLSDVLAGLLLAIIIALVCNVVWEHLPDKWKGAQAKRIIMYILIAGSLAVYIAISVTAKMISSSTWMSIYCMAGAIIGICVGNILDDKFVKYDPSVDNWKAKLVKSLLGLLTLALYYYLVVIRLGSKLAYMIPVYYVIMMVLATFVMPLVFKKWTKEENRIDKINNVEE